MLGSWVGSTGSCKRHCRQNVPNPARISRFWLGSWVGSAWFLQAPLLFVLAMCDPSLRQATVILLALLVYVKKHYISLENLRRTLQFRPPTNIKQKPAPDCTSQVQVELDVCCGRYCSACNTIFHWKPFPLCRGARGFSLMICRHVVFDAPRALAI